MLSSKDAVIFKVIRFTKHGDTLNDVYYQRNDKKGQSYVDYIARWNENEKEYQANTFDINGDYLPPEKIHELILNKDKNQLLWDTVISFSKSISDKIDLTDPKKISNAIKKPLEQLFKKNGFDPKNMDSWFALHLDTDDIHIHLGFLERKPKFRNLNKTTEKINYQFKRKGEILGPNQKYLYDFIKQTTLALTNEIDYQEVLGFRNQTLNQFKEIYKQFENFEKQSEYRELLNQFKENKYYKLKDFFYSNQNLATKKIVNELVLKNINKNTELQKSFNQFLKTVKKASWKSKELDKLFNVNKKNNFWVENIFSKSGIIPRLGNVILRNLRKYLNDKYHAKIIAARNAKREIYLIKIARLKKLKKYKNSFYETSKIEDKNYFKNLNLNTAEQIKHQIEKQAEHYKNILEKQIIKEEINQKISKLNQ